MLLTGHKSAPNVEKFAADSAYVYRLGDLNRVDMSQPALWPGK